MDPSTQNGVAMAVIGLVSTGLGYFFSWLSNRDKYRYDARLSAAEAEAKECNEKHATTAQALSECKEDREATKAELKQMWDTIHANVEK